MIPNRISDFKIEDRGLLSVIYGHTKDIFVGGDLRMYSFYQMLYLYLKSLGYDIVLLHDSINNFHSYSEKDLAAYLGLTAEAERIDSTVQTEVAIPGTTFDTPFGGALRQRRSTQPVLSSASAPDNKSWEKFDTEYMPMYRLRGSGEEFTYISRALKNKNLKAAFILRIASEANNVISDDSRKTFFASLEEDYASSQLNSKVILSYGGIEDESVLISSINKGIAELFIKYEGEDAILKPENSFKVDLPGADEITSLLHRRRLVDYVQIFGAKPIDKVVLSLIQRREKITELSRIDIAQHIEAISSKSAWDRLRELKGLEKVTAQIETIVEQIKRNQKRGNTGSIRPHLCFKGNPGTGKTTVAGIVAEIFKEEGILGIGHFTDAKVGDLIGEYIGGTRPKTEALFEKARGGVLFIDEAYGLLEETKNGFANEAVEIMLQKMEEAKWRNTSLVILAGYTKEIDELLEKGNPGLKERFSTHNHIVFEDYEPLVLLDIIKWNLKKLGYDIIEPDFENAVRQIIEKLFKTRPSKWSNARAMENLASEIDAQYVASKATDNILQISHIPNDKLKLIYANLGVKGKGMQQLDCLIGLSNVKQTIKNIFNQMRIDQMRNDRGAQSAQIYRMNFVFRGNPGTGKTTVARIISTLLSEIGLLRDGTCVEKGRSDLVGGYQGQTALKVNEVFKESIGKTLFIDEIYSLLTGQNDNYGIEAVNEMVRHMTLEEFDGKMAIVIAGYPDDVEEFLSANSGLPRRFSHFIDFEDYTDEELLQIYKIKLASRGLTLDSVAERLAIEFFSRIPRNKGFENAGLADRLLGITKSNLDNRINDLLNDNQEINDDVLNKIISSDFPNYTHTENSRSISSIDAPEPTQLSVSNAHHTLDIDTFKANVGLLSNGKGAGSAFLISREGLILTANHCINSGGEYTYRHNKNGGHYPAKLLWSSQKTDMAILQLETEKKDFEYFSMIGPDDNVSVNEEIILIGYPGGRALGNDPFCPEDKIQGTKLDFEISEQIRFDAIFTYANATHGYSGGPVIRKKDGRVVGVLHGGIVRLANVNLISDIRQLYKQENLNITIAIESTTDDKRNTI